MSDEDRLEQAVNDWAERISVDACACVREKAGGNLDDLSEEHWDLFSSAASAGASLALLAVVSVNPFDAETLRRLTRETP